MSAGESLSAVSLKIAPVACHERIESMLDPSLFIVAFVDSRDESRPAVTVRRVDSYGFALN
jgi:hypothetical protein